MKRFSVCYILMSAVLWLVIPVIECRAALNDNPLKCEVSISKKGAINLLLEKPLINFKLMNISKERVFILRYQIPDKELENSLFSVQMSGKAMSYKGRAIFRIGPMVEDWISLEPSGVIYAVFDLSKYYRFDHIGKYTIRYRSLQHVLAASSSYNLPSIDMSKVNYNKNVFLKDVNVPFLIESNEVELFIKEIRKTKEGGDDFQVGNETDCNENDHKILKGDQVNARLQAHLASLKTEDDEWYSMWFGFPTANHSSIVKNHYLEIKSRLNKRIHYHYGGDNCRANWWAYVHPVLQNHIWICNPYWYEGSSMRASILLHEAALWEGKNGLNDILGDIQAQHIARTDPSTAILNAENYRLGGLYSE